MCDEIPQPGDLCPGDIRMAFAQVVGELLDGFADDVEVQPALTPSPKTWFLERPSVYRMTFRQLFSMSSRSSSGSRDTDRFLVDVRPDAISQAALGHEVDLRIQEIFQEDP